MVERAIYGQNCTFYRANRLSLLQRLDCKTNNQVSKWKNYISLIDRCWQ